MEPLERLFQDPEVLEAPLPAPLDALYPGGLEISGDLVYANFVSSLDGVVALPSPEPSSGGAISGRNEADHFLMGLLRSFAGCVLVGAGTVRADGGHLWTPGYIHPPSALAFAALRQRLGLSREPELVVITATGDINPAERALESGSTIYTTPAGYRHLRGRLPAAVRLCAMAEDKLRISAVIEDLRSRGHRTILTEGGPNLIGQILAAGALDQLFLTLSPVLAGHGEGRLGLVEGLPLAPEDFRWSRLLSARRNRSHLFLRYALSRSGAE